MDDYNDGIDATSDLDTFQAWLQETAEREGTDQEEVIDQLMATYWILSELSTIMEDTEFAEMDESGGKSGSDHREIVEVIESIAKLNAPQTVSEAPHGTGAIDPGLVQLIESIASRSSSDRSDIAVELKIEKVRDEVDTLTRKLAEMDQQTEEMDETFHSALATHRSRLQQLKRDINELEGALTSSVDVERFLELETRFEARETEIDAQVHQLNTRFEDAYASIKTILEHLLSTTEHNETRIDILVDTLTSEIEALAGARKDAEALAELKREAGQRGIRYPRCDACDEVVDPALLVEPACPSCDRPVTGFETKSGLLRTKEIARTTAHRQEVERDNELARRLEVELEQIDEHAATDLPDDVSLDENN